jgi:acetyl esterase
MTDMAAVRDGEFDSPLSPAVLQWLHDLYVPEEIDPADWRLSPLRAEHLLGLPPTFLAVARHDPLLAETEAYAARLAAEKVPILLRRESGAARSVPALIEGDQATATCLDEAADFLAARLDKRDRLVTV